MLDSDILFGGQKSLVSVLAVEELCDGGPLVVVLAWDLTMICSLEWDGFDDKFPASCP
jgi:hypothetical protein